MRNAGILCGGGVRAESVKNVDWRIARVVEAGLATWMDLKERLDYEDFMQLDEILEVKYINEIKVANYRKSEYEKARMRRHR